MDLNCVNTILMPINEKEILSAASFSTAFSFQFYYLQVIQTLQDRYGEHTAYSDPKNN